MRSKSWKTAVPVAVTAMLVLGACGSDEKTTSTSAAPTTAAAGAATTAAGGAATTAAGSATTAATGGTSATTASSAAGSGSTVSPKDIGLIDGKYKGTSGFELDPADCPEDWDPKQGITDTEINLFGSLPTSGPLAGFGVIADGIKAYFKLINDGGGIDGRKINYDTKDDGYKPDQTKSNVDEAISSGKYASLFFVLGTANNLAVWDTTNDECMPQMLNGTGAAQWGDVEGHPWTTGMQLDYFTEAALWASWLKTEHPELTKVAEITYNNDYGQSYHTGFAYNIKGSDIKVVKQEVHEAAAANLDNQFTTLAASGAEVLLIETSGAFCTQAMAAVEKQANWRPLVIMSFTCGSLNQYFQPLIDQGLTGKDTYMMQSFKDANDPASADDPFIKLYTETLKAQGLDPKVTSYFTGWVYAWFMVDILKNAATYQGGLDRGNIVLAARNVRANNPALIDGLTSVSDGMKDAYLTEGGMMVKYTVTDPKTLGVLEPAGDLINLEGKLGTYKTVEAAVSEAAASASTTTG